MEDRPVITAIALSSTTANVSFRQGDDEAALSSKGYKYKFGPVSGAYGAWVDVASENQYYISLDGLTQNTQYRIIIENKVTARQSVETLFTPSQDGSYSFNVSAPYVTGDGNVDLTITVIDGGSTLADFRYRVVTAGSSGTWSSITETEAGSGIFNIAGLSNGAIYNLEVLRLTTETEPLSTAVPMINKNVFINSFSVKDKPAAVVSVVAGDQSAVVTFQKELTDSSVATDFEYRLASSLTHGVANWGAWVAVPNDAAPVEGNANRFTFNISGLLNHTTYQIQMRHSNGSNHYSTNSFTPLGLVSPNLPGAPVSVNFNVEITAEGELQIGGEITQLLQNVVSAQYALPVNTLYDNANNVGLIELWEPSADPDNIKAQLANSTTADGPDFAGKYQEAAKRLVKGIQKVLVDEIDCKNASPFNNVKYDGIVEYQTQRDFGRVALSTYAHYLFGHVDATAAISNDIAFQQAMLSLPGAGGAAAVAEDADEIIRYDAFDLTEVNDNNVEAWTENANEDDAMLAKRLVLAILKKGFAGADLTGSIVESDVNTATSDSIANIVKQVVGQDASRLTHVDNNQRTKDKHQLLRFYPNDVIYMNIKLSPPLIVLGSSQVGVNSNLVNRYTEESFTVKFTLGAEDQSINSV